MEVSLLLGSSDGFRIPMQWAPGDRESYKEHQNFKNLYSIILIAMVDSHYLIIWGNCGYPGNLLDAP